MLHTVFSHFPITTIRNAGYLKEVQSHVGENMSYKTTLTVHRPGILGFPPTGKVNSSGSIKPHTLKEL